MNMKSIAAVGVLISPFALSACGPTGGLGGGSFAYADYANMNAEVLSQGITPVASLPTSGSSTYTGFMNVSDFDTFQIHLGTLEMEVSFANSDFTGSVGNFSQVSGTSLTSASGSISMSGTLTGNNGMLSSSALDGTWSGNVNGKSESGQVEGYFVGSDAGGIVVDLDSTGDLMGIGVATQ